MLPAVTCVAVFYRLLVVNESPLHSGSSYLPLCAVAFQKINADNKITMLIEIRKRTKNVEGPMAIKSFFLHILFKHFVSNKFQE